MAWGTLAVGQPAEGGTAPMTAAESQALVARALTNELRAAQDAGHPMRYQLRKTSPRLTTTKEICETKDGEVARLISVNDKPLSEADSRKEEARLDALVADPSKQRHRKQAEDADSARALMVLRALPKAFLYEYAGSDQGSAGKQGSAGRIEKFNFHPNPGFSAPNLETQALTTMSGQIWIDPERERVTRLEGRLQRDVDFGWGVLGRLNKGGWIVIEQADVGGDQWRVVHFQMQMSGRVIFKTRVFDTTEDETQYAPLQPGMSYQKAIETLRGDPK